MVGGVWEDEEVWEDGLRLCVQCDRRMRRHLKSEGKETLCWRCRRSYLGEYRSSRMGDRAEVHLGRRRELAVVRAKRARAADNARVEAEIYREMKARADAHPGYCDLAEYFGWGAVEEMKARDDEMWAREEAEEEKLRWLEEECGLWDVETGERIRVRKRK